MIKATKTIDNLALWNAVEQTNPDKTKKVKIGALSLTAINATSQIKEATRHWGSYGSTWGLKNIEYEYMDIDKTRLAIVKTMFYYPSGEFELSTTIKVYYMTQGQNGYLKIDDDYMKKAETDLTTKALSKLGFNADVFMGLYDDNKYIALMKEKFSEENKQPEKPQQKEKPKRLEQDIPKPKRLSKVQLDKMKVSDNLKLLKKSFTFYALSSAQKFAIETRIKELKTPNKIATKKKMTKVIHAKILKSKDLEKVEATLIDYAMSVSSANQIKTYIIQLKKVK